MLLLGCDRELGAGPEGSSISQIAASHIEPASPGESLQPESLQQLSHRIQAQRSQIQALLEQEPSLDEPESDGQHSASQHSASQHSASQLSCAAGSEPAGGTADTAGTVLKTELVVRVFDAREEARQLFPANVKKMLSSDEFSSFDELFRPMSDPLVLKHGPLLKSRGLAEQALQALSALRRLPFVATFFILDFKAPRLVLKKGKRRREWIPGRVHARLAVHELPSGKLHCADPVVVSNDVADEPIRLRLRELTRKRLIVQLGTKLRAAALERLGARFGRLPRAYARSGAQSRPISAETRGSPLLNKVLSP